ncbi:ATP-binding cassette domain-containing protein [Hydrogenoanaerobacterium sp.]|uniref:energy-coupling factor ABC transporter ATP-binding protein n=1 Tax=Hydrogenoanaerobacterium sp. TaxID=2953763 RepID=UPI0028A00D38|nr:ATP-binding cassette domain-containing protein [Hydrogenoanaerobacterium sp.]
METILSIRDLKYTYPDGTEALKGVNLDVKRGERIAVLGSNGSGKSTLFLCLNGVHKALSGSILFDGEPLGYDKKGLIKMRKNVGIVFQDPETQLFCVDVYQEVAFGPHNLGYSKEQVHSCVTQSLAAMNLTELKDKPPHFLSGGQKKRVSVASVLSMSPQVLLFDEPTSALDPVHARRLMEEIDKLSADGITILMATHDVNTAYAWADRIVVLGNGEVQAAGTPQEVFSDLPLLEKTGLQPPFVLRMYSRLCAGGVLANKGAPPRTIEELESLL